MHLPSRKPLHDDQHEQRLRRKQSWAANCFRQCTLNAGLQSGPIDNGDHSPEHLVDRQFLKIEPVKRDGLDHSAALAIILYTARSSIGST